MNKVSIKKPVKWIKTIDWIFFFLLLACYTLVTGWLFYKQAYGNESSYHADFKVYILAMQGLAEGYHFPYPILFKLGAFLHLYWMSVV